MHGNVRQWCADAYDGDSYSKLGPIDPLNDKGGDRVIRGGSWFSPPQLCRAAFRNSLAPGLRYGHDGFRVVCLTTPTPSVSPAHPKDGNTFANTLGMKFVRISAGRFTMGSNDYDVRKAATRGPNRQRLLHGHVHRDSGAMAEICGHWIQDRGRDGRRHVQAGGGRLRPGGQMVPMERQIQLAERGLRTGGRPSGGVCQLERRAGVLQMVEQERGQDSPAAD